jgi:glycosyltransferase involved in cell wall biosynthesis
MTKISVIIPVKNEAEKIERCLEAVFSQSYKPDEVLVVDGHSTDRTVENAKGEFIAFTDYTQEEVYIRDNKNKCKR